MLLLCSPPTRKETWLWLKLSESCLDKNNPPHFLSASSIPSGQPGALSVLTTDSTDKRKVWYSAHSHITLAEVPETFHAQFPVGQVVVVAFILPKMWRMQPAPKLLVAISATSMERFKKKICDTQPRPKGLSYRKWEELFPMFLRGKCWGGKVPRKV